MKPARWIDPNGCAPIVPRGTIGDDRMDRDSDGELPIAGSSDRLERIPTASRRTPPVEEKERVARSAKNLEKTPRLPLVDVAQQSVRRAIARPRPAERKPRTPGFADDRA